MGLLPLLIFSFLVGTMNNFYSLFVGFALSITVLFMVKRPIQMIYIVSTVTFAISLVCYLLLPEDLDGIRAFVFVELVFVLLLIVSRLARYKVVVRIAKSNNLMAKNYWAESFRVAFQAQYAFSLHLLIVLLLSIFATVNYPAFARYGIVLVAQLIIVSIILLQTIRLDVLNRKLFKEEWLPVITESGKVTGRIAKSVTKIMKNKFMHPVVRVALIYNGRIYLQPREKSRLLNPEMLDYPFEKYMQYDHQIDDTVNNNVRNVCSGFDNIPLRYLLKYTFENEVTKRLIFLYVSVIEDEETFQKLQLKEGKLWTEAQIDDNIGQNVFSECFELEYEYLKNTVLLMNRLKEEKGAAS